jgi:hypothetical protein
MVSGVINRPNVCWSQFEMLGRICDASYSAKVRALLF